MSGSGSYRIAPVVPDLEFAELINKLFVRGLMDRVVVDCPEGPDGPTKTKLSNEILKSLKGCSTEPNVRFDVVGIIE
jgi:hypothetical protein